MNRLIKSLFFIGICIFNIQAQEKFNYNYPIDNCLIDGSGYPIETFTKVSDPAVFDFNQTIILIQDQLLEKKLWVDSNEFLINAVINTTGDICIHKISSVNPMVLYADMIIHSLEIYNFPISYHMKIPIHFKVDIIFTIKDNKIKAKLLPSKLPWEK